MTFSHITPFSTMREHHGNPGCKSLTRRHFMVESVVCGRRGGLMVSALNSGASGPGSSPGQGHCVVFLGKTLYSHSASLHPGV